MEDSHSVSRVTASHVHRSSISHTTGRWSLAALAIVAWLRTRRSLAAAADLVLVRDKWTRDVLAELHRVLNLTY